MLKIIIWAFLLSCNVWAADKHIPFLVFDLDGGAALPGNFLVGKDKGPLDLLTSYDKLGWNPRAEGALDTRFGLPMAGRNVSKILQGMTSVMSEGAQKRFRMASILNYSMDDTSSNPLSALPLLSFVGNRGSIFRNGVGLYPSSSGGHSKSPIDFLPLKPLFVETFSTFRKVGSGFVDPRVNEDVMSVYALKTNSSDFDRNVLTAGIVGNVLMQNTGPGTITISHCDYHDGTRVSGDSKDFEIGFEIGRAVELAHRMGKPLFIQILSDGGVSAEPGTRIWVKMGQIR